MGGQVAIVDFGPELFGDLFLSVEVLFEPKERVLAGRR